jgi:DHA2 family multidrug resistance protein-like MFS transporter
MVLLATGLVALAFMLHGTRLVTIAAPMFLFGVGYGLFQSPNNRTILGSAPRNRTARRARLRDARARTATHARPLGARDHRRARVAIAFATLAAVASSLRRASPKAEPVR